MTEISLTNEMQLFNMSIMKIKTNQLKNNVIAARCDAKFKKQVIRQCNRDGLASESGAVIGLLQAWLSGEVEYKNYRFVAKEE